MKTLLKLLVLAGVLYGGYRGVLFLFDRSAESTASDRVTVMLREKAAGDEQTALCMWAQGAFLLQMDEIARYIDPFARFWRDSGLEPSSKVTDAEVEERRGDTVLVTVSGPRGDIILRVTPKTPIEVVE